jgi:hypothetical protein
MRAGSVACLCDIIKPSHDIMENRVQVFRTTGYSWHNILRGILRRVHLCRIVGQTPRSPLCLRRGLPPHRNSARQARNPVRSGGRSTKWFGCQPFLVVRWATISIPVATQPSVIPARAIGHKLPAGAGLTGKP